jgi:hypothetical protein
MSITLSTDDARELQSLYARYKALALSTSAALMLGDNVRPLGERLEELRRDCSATQQRRTAHGRELAACLDAVADLRPLIDGDTTDRALEHARASHRRLRRAVWDLIPCEYVPCCAPGHDHHEG